PCGEVALSLKYMLDGDIRYNDPQKVPYRPGIRFLEQRVMSVYDPVQKLLNTDPAEACLMYHGHEIRTAEEAQRSIAEAVGDSVIGQGDEEKKRISLASCNLAWSRRETHQITTKLAYCEVMMRAKKEYYKDFMGTTNIFDDFKTKVALPCAHWAYDQRSIW